MRLVLRQVNTSSSRWLTSSYWNTVTPRLGSLPETRVDRQRERARSVSPGRTASRKRTSSQATPQIQAMSGAIW